MKDKIILLSHLLLVITGVSIQPNRILMDAVTDLNFVF